MEEFKNTRLGELISEIEKYSEKYEFSFQFWGPGNNNVFIAKDYVNMYDIGGLPTIEEALTAALRWVYKVNRTPVKKRIKT